MGLGSLETWDLEKNISLNMHVSFPKTLLLRWNIWDSPLISADMFF